MHRLIQPLNQLQQRILLLAGISLYLACFNWMYVHYLNPVWRGFGFGFDQPAGQYLLAAWLGSLLPGLWMPLNVRRPSQLAYWVLYFVVFIPSMFVPLYAGINTASDVLPLLMVLFFGFAIIGASYLFPLYKLRPMRVSCRSFWIGFGCFAIATAAVVLYTFRSTFSLVSFADIYDVRYAASELIEGTRLNYPLMWFYGAINPFMMACGLYYRRWLLFVAGVLGQVLVYGSFGTKASLLSIVFISVFYLLLKRGRLPFALKMTWGVLALVGGVCATCVSGEQQSGLVQVGVSYVVLMRTFSYCGLLTAQYLNFFMHNPFTYYSHVTGISWLIHYPFKYPLGMEIGYYYYDPFCDTTAHFLATDGLAALGLPGVLFASILCSCLFWGIDSVSRRHDPRLAASAIGYAVFSLANLSMFTTILSNGLGLLALTLYFLPPNNRSSSYHSPSMVIE